MIIMTGCAYYNMYFNAEKSYREAEEKRKLNNQVDKNLYENSIKELSKILEFYPNSKWVDDALLMMGQCYYRQEKYDKAKRKYIEIITNYPNSDLINKAKVLLAEVEIASNNFDTAVELIESIKMDNLDIEPLDLMNLNAELSISLKDSSKALDLYLEAAEETKNPGEKIIFLEKASKLAEETKNYNKTADIYKKLIDNTDIREKKFSYTMKYSDALQKQGYIDSALTIIKNILSIEEYDKYALEGDLKMGELYYSLGDYQKSYDKLDEILRVNQKNRENGAFLSKTAFFLGEYYFNYKKDFENAIVMYDSSGFYDRGNDTYKLAVERKRTINEFQKLKKKVPVQNSKVDTLASKLSRIDNKLLQYKDSVDQNEYNKLSLKKIETFKDLKKQNKELANDKMLLAEKYMYDINQPDSAVNYLLEVSKMSDLPHISSRALYILSSMDNSLYEGYKDSILIKYPNTIASNAVRNERGIELVNVIEDSAKYYFNIASDTFLDSLYSESIEEYLKIVEKFEDSPIAPKIMNAAALIAENYLYDMEKAADIYSQIKEKYPKSTYANFASIKLSTDSSVPQKRTVEKKESEADKWYMMDRRND